MAAPDRFGAVFERHAPGIVGFVASRVGPSDAEDVSAETFITAFRTRRRYDMAYPDAGPWLYGIATNVIRHHRRSEMRRRRHADDRPPGYGPEPVAALDVAGQVEAEMTTVGQRAELEAALAQLDDTWTDPLLLFVIAGLTYQEIGLALALPVGTARSRIYRARARLRELLGTSGQYHDMGGALAGNDDIDGPVCWMSWNSSGRTCRPGRSTPLWWAPSGDGSTRSSPRRTGWSPMASADVTGVAGRS